MDATKLKVWLPFDESATLDKCGNTWTATGSPTISATNAISGKALQLNGSNQYLKSTVELGGQDFTVHCYERKTGGTKNGNVFSLYYDETHFMTLNGEGWYLNYTRTNSMPTGFNHIEFDYVHAEQKIYYFLNGTLVNSRTTDIFSTRRVYTLKLGNDSWGSVGSQHFWGGSIDEFMIFDGVALHTANFIPPTAADYAALASALGSRIDFTADVQRKISNRFSFTADVQRTLKTKWRYINLGTVDTLYGEEGFIAGFTLENLPESKSKTGTAFYQTTREKCFDIPATDEIWIKFDVYFDGYDRWRAYNDGSNGTTGATAQTNGDFNVWVNDANNGSVSNICIANQLQTVLLHMKSGSSAGVVEAWVDGTKIYTYTGDVNHGQDFADIYLQSDGSDTFFSNVIISNAEIGLNDGYIKFSADVQRKVSNIFEFVADVQRKVNNRLDFTFDADVVIRDVLPVTFAADVQRRVTNRLEFFADVEILDTFPFEFDADINRAIKGKVKLFAVDTSDYFSGGGLSSSGDSAETLTPVVIPSQRIPPAPDNSIGLQSIEIYLSEQQLTDNVAFVGVVPFDIMFPVQGQYLDYVFDMRVERVQQHGILYSCECCADTDQLLYTQIAYTIPPNTEWSSGGSSSSESTSKIESVAASSHARCLAATIGKTPVIQFDDFQSTVLMENAGGVTYADLVRDVFGWSSRVPTHLINVFIRDDKIYFVQRGHELRLLDLSDTKHTIPTITHELVRMTWGSTPWSKTETREIKRYQPPSSSSSSGTGGGQPRTAHDEWDGRPESGYVNYTYNDDGLLIQSFTYVYNHETNQQTRTTVNHGYDKDGTLIYTGTFVQSYGLTSESESSSQTEEYKGYTTLPNGEKFLARESIIRRVGENSLTPTELVESKTVIHSPTRAGQGHTTVISDGEDIGGVVGQNTGDDRVTPFSRHKAGSLIDSFVTVDTKSRTLNGLSLYDSSFPIHNTDKLIELTEAIKWLNRRTKETISMTIYEYPHLIDFNDRIIFNGAQYFLVSNVATTNARIFNEQRITFVRWY